MRKLAVIILLFCAFFTVSYAQTLEIDWGTFEEFKSDEYFQKYLGADTDGFYMIKSDNIAGCKNAKLWLEYYSKAMHSQESSQELLLPSVSGLETEYEEMFLVDGKLILFTSVVDPNRKQRIAYVQYVNKDGTLKNKPKEIGQIPTSNGDFGFNTKASPDGKLVMFYYNQFFKKYNNEEINVRIFDGNLKETLNKKLVLPAEFKDRILKVLQYELSNNGNVYLSIAAEPAGKQKTAAAGTTIYEYYMVSYNSQKNDFYSVLIDLKKYQLKTMMFAINKDEVVYVCGYYNDKTARNGEIRGFYYKTINPGIQKITSGPAEEKTTYKAIDRIQYPDFEHKRFWDKNENTKYLYDIKNILFQENGGVVFLGEQNFIDTVKIPIPGEKDKTTKVYYYHHCDILAAGIDDKGVLSWYHRIPKDQYGVEDAGYFSSYAVAQNVSQIKILFNDNAKNVKLSEVEKVEKFKSNVKTGAKGQSSIVTIYNDGSIDKAVMFNNADLKTIFITKAFGQDDKSFIIGGSKGKYYKFGSFYFE